MILGLSILPLTIATGMGIDYAKAARLQTKLNAIADAAALAAVTQPMMKKTRYDAALAAGNMFYYQAQNTAGAIFPPLATISYTDNGTTLTGSNGVVTVTVTDTYAAGVKRTASISYTAQSINSFGSILGMATIPVGGTSSTQAKTAPDIDFYIMLDTSPSMALPATSAGLTQLTSLTGGCAFACHESDPAGDGMTTKNSKGVVIDYYQVARNASIALRVDRAISAVQDMATSAKSYGTTNDAAYRMSVSTFNVGTNFSTIAPLNSNLATVSTQAGTASVLSVYRNNYLTSSNFNNDQNTDFTTAFARMMTLMPVLPGQGSGISPDTPQAMLYIITDGMRDEDNGGRQLGPIPTAQCDAIKARGIRIAILYTTYLPESLSDSWSQSNVAPKLPSVSPALLACSSPGLFQEVTTDGDITAALNTLFQQGIATARVTR